MFERVLTTIETAGSDDRVEVVEIAEPGVPARLEMRTQQHVSGLGWVTQRRISFDAQDVRALRLALGMFEPGTSASTAARADDGVVSLETWRGRQAG